MKHDIKQRLSDDVFVECKIQFDCSYALHYSITEEQFKMGMETCLNDKEFYSYVTVYVVADEKTDMESLQETVESYCSKFNAHEQFLYFAISPMMEKDAIEQHYGENPQSFGKHMYDCDLIQHIECTEMNRDTGIVERTIEKR